jgi:hypothetical protein
MPAASVLLRGTEEISSSGTYVWRLSRKLLARIGVIPFGNPNQWFVDGN